MGPDRYRMVVIALMIAQIIIGIMALCN